jgi:hypothetical protein
MDLAHEAAEILGDLAVGYFHFPLRGCRWTRTLAVSAGFAFVTSSMEKSINI